MKDREGGGRGRERERERDFAISSCSPFSSNHFRVRGRDFSLGPLLLQPLISDEGFPARERPASIYLRTRRHESNFKFCRHRNHFKITGKHERGSVNPRAGHRTAPRFTCCLMSNERRRARVASRALFSLYSRVICPRPNLET